jgi:hypothetical protein
LSPRRHRRVAIAVTVAMLCLGLASIAPANNLDRVTATSAAKRVAKQKCRDIRGCKDHYVRNLHRVSRHKALGKIYAVGERQGVRFECVRQIVIKLEHETGDLLYGTSRKRCRTR